MHAVCRRAIHDEVFLRVICEHSQRHIECEGVARTASVAIRRNNGGLRDLTQSAAQCAQTVRAVTIVIADEDLQGCVGSNASLCEIVSSAALACASTRQAADYTGMNARMLKLQDG